MSPDNRIEIDGVTVLSPREVSARISQAVGAHFSVRQVDRLGDNNELTPIVYRRRRFYREKEVEKLIKSGAVRKCITNPDRARLRRRDYRKKIAAVVDS